MRPEDTNLIERYLENSLSGVELKEFMDRLEKEDEFRKLVAFHNLLIESIQIAEDSRLQKSIEAEIQYKKPLIPFGLKLIFIFLFVTFSGILLWEYIGNGQKHHITNFAVFDLFKKAKDKVQKPKDNFVSSKTTIPDSVRIQETLKASDEKMITTEASNSEMDSASDSEEQMVVKKDQLLVSFSLKATDLHPNKKTVDNNSLAQSTTEKLNPAAGLTELHEENDQKYDVEFWVSPVNYRGYKLSANKLILFGIEEPDAIQLFSSDNLLLMKYGKDYFQLISSGEFLSFSVLKENELPASLR